MARIHAHCHFCQNFLPNGKDELTKAVAKAPINGNGTLISTLTISRVLISGLTIAFAAALYLNNKLIKEFIKIYLKA